MRELFSAIRALAKPPPYTGNTRVNYGPLMGNQVGPSLRQLSTMGESYIVFGIVDSICASVSKAEWHLYRKQIDGRRRYGPMEENRQEVTKHAAIDLLNQPNPFMTRQLFIETVQQHYELTGEQWWMPQMGPFSGVGPLALWPIRPDKMMPVPHKDKYLSGYVYRAPDGEQVPFELNEIIYTRRPNPIDAYRGFGPIQTLLAEIDSSRLSAEWNRNFFFNSAEPGGLIKFDHRLSDDEWDEFQERWRETHQGVSNVNRVGTLENGAEWVDQKYTHKDMQFVELSQISEEKVRKAFRFPKPILGSVDDVNRANAEAAEVVYSRWLIMDRLEKLKQVLNNFVLPMFGDTARDLEFCYDNPVPDDRDADNNELTAKTNAAVALVAAGFDPDDACDTVGLPRMRFSKPAPAAPPQLTPGEDEEPTNGYALKKVRDAVRP